MDKNAEEVTRAIAIKLLGGIEGFKLTKLENYKDYIVLSLIHISSPRD